MMTTAMPVSSTSLPKQQAWRRFITAHGVVFQKLDAELKAAGQVSYDWYDVLMAIHEAEERQLKMSQLAEFTLLSQSGMTRRVHRMEAAGLIERHADPEDGRSVIVTLTASGQEAIRNAWAVYEQFIASVFESSLSEQEAQVLWNVFDRIIQKSVNPEHPQRKTGTMTEQPQ
ncbi:MAG: MarR family transcriptional regulator [Verrucomicrobiota bacterium]